MNLGNSPANSKRRRKEGRLKLTAGLKKEKMMEKAIAASAVLFVVKTT